MSASPLGSVFDLDVLDIRSGFVLFRASGRGVDKWFAHEAGGHRWQRVPPTEKHGRRQTSTVTVAVLEEVSDHVVALREEDIEERTIRGSGPGGQHRNMTDSCVVVKHKPTGITVRLDSKSQKQNRVDARAILVARLNQRAKAESSSARNKGRKQQVGSGMRGDKIRTVQVHNGLVTNHESGKKIRFKDYARGNWDGLF